MLNDIVAYLDHEIARLAHARQILAGSSHNGAAPQRKRRTMNAEARARISAAQQKRWVKRKRAAAK